MKTAAEYAELAETLADGARDEGTMGYANVYALLANAAATLEAAALMGPTPEDQRRLDELFACQACEAEWQGAGDHVHVCDLVKAHAQKRHRCGCGTLSR